MSSGIVESIFEWNCNDKVFSTWRCCCASFHFSPPRCRRCCCFVFGLPSIMVHGASKDRTINMIGGAGSGMFAVTMSYPYSYRSLNQRPMKRSATTTTTTTTTTTVIDGVGFVTVMMIQV
jgi:hypothetical protein